MKEQHTTMNITTPQTTLDVLQRDFSHCFDKEGNFDIEKFKQEIAGAEVNFSKESYGMDWLGKSYARVRATDPATTLLKEDTVWNSKEENKNSENLLIKGDNLEVLKHLSHAYHEQVKMIYIDPPYNTGTDGFVYEDDRKFIPEEFAELAGVELEQAKRILDFVDSKSNSHSAWLSFMYPRLYIARQLLNDDGVIFVSIDDNEVAQLRILMDEIFGADNFVGSFIWHKKVTGGYDNENLNIQHEYILLYSKIITQAKIYYDQKESSYKLTDENGKKYKWDSLWNIGGLTYSKSLDYAIMAPDGSEVWPIGERGISFWLWSKDRVEKERDLLKFEKNKNGQWRVYKRVYASDAIVPGSILDKEVVKGNTFSSSEVKNLFDGLKIFDYAKPTTLLKYIIEKGLGNDGIVLDFFAGSGSTADAVMQLNAKDGGNRKFVLAQLPEKINPVKNKGAFDFVKNTLKIKEPTIFDITKERLVRAAKKIKEENKDSEHIKSVDFGFKVFETVPLWDGYADEPTEFSANLKMFDVAKLKDSVLAILLTTWKTFDGIPLTTPLAEIDLGGYTGYYGDGKLYLVHSGFTAKHLASLLKSIDTDSSFSPATIVLFGYHFESARMREIAENVKSYANKKSMDIECITRY